MTDIEFHTAQLIDGVALGSVYGIVALSVVFLFRANKLFNFALAEIATLFVIFGLYLLSRFNYVISMFCLLIVSFTSGVLLHFSVMRAVTERRKVLRANESVITIGLLIIFNGISAYVAGDEPRAFPTPFQNSVMKLGSISVSTQSIVILISSLCMACSFFFMFRFTDLGLAFEAVAENTITARLRGIRSSNMLAIAWGFAVLMSTLGGVLIAPVFFVTPGMMTNLFAYSLIAIVVGGRESPMGAFVGGVIIGVVESFSANIPFVGSDLKFVAVVVLLMLFLLFRPRGIWGRLETRKV